jgi:hypothetical protein
MELPSDRCTSLFALTYQKIDPIDSWRSANAKANLSPSPAKSDIQLPTPCFPHNTKKNRMMYLISTKNEQDTSEPSVSELGNMERPLTENPGSVWPLDIDTFFETDKQHNIPHSRLLASDFSLFPSVWPAYNCLLWRRTVIKSKPVDPTGHGNERELWLEVRFCHLDRQRYVMTKGPRSENRRPLGNIGIILITRDKYSRRFT